MNEVERIARLAAIFAAANPNVSTGIGDDAAVVAPDLVWTVDAQVEGTHFEHAWLSWEDIGYRSFMAAASDLAAMGAEPIGALSSLVLAPSVTDAELEALARGQKLAAEAIGATVIGGNLARGRETSVTTTLLGRAARPIHRAGAKAGDRIWLAGEVGLAAAGLRVLSTGGNVHGAQTEVRAWRRPRALLAQGREMAKVASAAIDISDGLAGDLAHVARASGVRLHLDRAFSDEALYGGEDYALVATSPVEITGFVEIGRVEAGAPAVVMKGRELEARGWDHFGG